MRAQPVTDEGWRVRVQSLESRLLLRASHYSPLSEINCLIRVTWCSTANLISKDLQKTLFTAMLKASEEMAYRAKLSSG